MPESRFNSQPKKGNFCSSFKNVQAGPPFRPRIVHNYNLAHVESSDWRLDFYKSKKLSCAEVLKFAIKNNSITAITQGTSSQSTSIYPVIKANAHKVSEHSRPPVRKSPVTNKKCFQKNFTANKVSDYNTQIKTQNRLQILQGIDDVAQPSHTVSTVSACTSNAISSPNVGRSRTHTRKRKIKCKASQNDAISLNDRWTLNDGPLVEENTKYDLPLRIREKTVSYKQLIPTCPTLKLWDSQNKFKIGFIPFGDLSLPSCFEATNCGEDLIALHTVITSSGKLILSLPNLIQMFGISI